jgi:feruloyl esterase
MNHRTSPVILTVLLAGFALISIPAAAQQTCNSLASVKIPNVTITKVTAGNPGDALPAQAGGMGNVPARKINVPYCRIEAVSAPSSDSHIGIEVWLPAPANWNGKFLAAGNPGFIGGLTASGLAQIMEQGYVAGGTDTGHVDTDNPDPETQGFKWAIGHPEKWADWGYRAVHEMVVVTKTMAEKYYGKGIKYSYWNSCHNGGNQALNEAQRYPDDFDGIVAADPAFWISHLQAGSLYISWVALKDGKEGAGFIPPAKVALLNKAAIAACDKNDGLEDGLIVDPTKCKFDPATIQCKGADAETCLTAAQVSTAKKIYAGAKFKDGTPIYSGFEPGSESNWDFMIDRGPFTVNINYFKGMVFQDPQWDYRTFDPDRDTKKAMADTAKYVDASNPDLRPLKKSNGKLIIVSSWNSLALPPRQVAEYYKDVVKTMGGLAQTQDFARLFSIPGAGGCVVGPSFKAFEAMQDWVEKGIAPDQITYSYTDGSGRGGKATKTRPVCAYPKISKYKGSGDVNDAASFTCVSPE